MRTDRTILANKPHIISKHTKQKKDVAILSNYNMNQEGAREYPIWKSVYNPSSDWRNRSCLKKNSGNDLTHFKSWIMNLSFPLHLETVWHEDNNNNSFIWPLVKNSYTIKIINKFIQKMMHLNYFLRSSFGGLKLHLLRLFFVILCSTVFVSVRTLNKSNISTPYIKKNCQLLNSFYR